MAASYSQATDNKARFHKDERQNPYYCEEIEWEKIKSARLKEGYREGISAGEETSVQEGFDCGYAVGFRLVQDIAYLRGILCAISDGGTWRKDRIPEAGIEALSLKDLMQELVNMEKTILKLIQETEHEGDDCPSIADLSPTLSSRLEEIKTIVSRLQTDLKKQKPSAANSV